MSFRLHVIERFFDICFPPSREACLVRELSVRDIESLYAPSHKNGIQALASYAHPHIKALVHEAKFHNNKKATELLAQFIQIFLHNHPSHAASIWIPIPLSPARLRMRGYNQTAKILHAVHAENPLEIQTDVLTRIKHTPPQTELARSERLTNLKGAFSVLRPELVKDHHVVLIDDVTTTGATLREAELELSKHAPRSITLLALSH